jgi:hypothetical protein
MRSNQTASDSLHPPVIAGVSTGGESRGLFDEMKPLPGTLDWYRQKGESNPDIAILVTMIDGLGKRLKSALEVAAKPRP